MNPQHHHRDEDHLRLLLAAADRDAATPDADFLNRLREQSTAAYLAAFVPATQRPNGRRPMLSSALRALTAMAAAFLAFIGICFWLSASRSDPTFGQVLEDGFYQDTATVHARLVRADRGGDLWARLPDQLRWEHANGTYEIVRGNKLWEVDEKANRATSQDSPYCRVGHPHALDLLALLEVPVSDECERLLGERPTDRVERDGKDYLVYRREVPGRTGPLQLEALVDADTRRLHSLRTQVERDGKTQPVAELTLLAFNGPVDDDKFAVKDTLTEDGRVGKVIDAQGIVTVKPVMQQRWTPVRTQLLLQPGDWVRTDSRGANAVAIRLVKQTRAILGPGTLVEVINPTQLRLLEGELEISVPMDAVLEMLGPGEQKLTVQGTRHYRLDQEQLVAVAREPAWLKGFKGATTQESIGSLVAKVDGRNVPLTVGYHKVSVDIRDQIARTVIEESFVNHTNAQLEGVFYFPLPQDASISGFGMWIGNELVTADVVERQRAREIYETILRERRDPGLLEWSGGNLFKARVFPIFAHSEKRITITYTQVLPLRGNRYRYSYGLQSELLKQHPLRELGIDVKINSAVPLKSVTSPTHPTRTNKTEHSAHVEFSAQEYTPTRDFEVVIEVAGRQSDLVLIPHRRADDGYFMLQLTPSSGAKLAERDLLQDGDPLHVLLVADTSGTMDAGQRANQAAFIAALLSALTPRDTFNLAACDVECDWSFEQPVPANPANIAAAQQFLVNRTSLGWTDLDKAFASALKQSGPQSHLIYIGDGIPTTSDVDPVAFGKRLRSLYQSACQEQPTGQSATCHAVAVGNLFETGVLKAIASMGGGSVRRVTGEQTPLAIAVELLQEIARPTLRNLKVEFHGLRTARVYPEELPNVPTGAQQVLLGRYLPEGRDQAGAVIVTGTLGGKPVQFRTPISLRDAEQGNSFIPRLWARMHLDHLLDQGSSQVIQDEIIALSEEYQIITPYTSLLVLESDADRERFKVKRRFQMRDGEKFFAEGKDNVNYELAQKQMKLAGGWRLGLRRSVLGQFATLGRDVRMFQQPSQGYGIWNGASIISQDFAGRSAGGAGYPYGFGGGRLNYNSIVDELNFPLSSMSAPVSGPMGGTGMAGGFGPFDDVDGLRVLRDRGGEVLEDFAEDKSSFMLRELQLFEEDTESDVKNLTTARDEPLAEAATPAEPASLDALSTDAGFVGSIVWDAEVASREFSGFGRRSGRSSFGDFFERVSETATGSLLSGIELMSDGRLVAGSHAGLMYRPSAAKRARYDRESVSSDRLRTLFPHLPPPLQPRQEPISAWPDTARELARSLLRTDKLLAMKGGVEIKRETESFNTRWSELASRMQQLEIYSPSAWLRRIEDNHGQTLLHWCDEKERGVLARAFQLGQLRKSTPQDLRTPPLGLGDFSLTSLDQVHPDYAATVETPEKDRALLVLKQPSGQGYEIRVLVDTVRHVILTTETRQNGKLPSTQRFDDFIEVAGCWWARRIETTDDQGRRSMLVTQIIKPLTATVLDQQIKQELAGREQVLFVTHPLPSVAEAKQALTRLGELTFDVHLVLLVHFAQSQQWSRAREHLEQAERLAAGKPGMRWLHHAFLNISRRHEELKMLIVAEADRLAKGPATAEDLALAEHLVNQSSGILEANEMLRLLDTLRPIYERQPLYRDSKKHWTQMRVNYLQQAGQAEASLALRKQMATDHPRDAGLQRQVASVLAETGDHEAAYAWLTRVLKDGPNPGKDGPGWESAEEESLRGTYAQLLESEKRYGDLVEYLADWMKKHPESLVPYPQYLSALIRTDQEAKADVLIARWLQEGQVAGDVPPAVGARFQAAVAQALGQGHHMYTNRLEERWLKPLADAVLFFARRDKDAHRIGGIMSHGHFQPSDECRRVRRTIAGILTSELDKLSVSQLQRFIGWVLPNDPALPAETWKQLLDGVHKRWVAETRPELKEQLASTLVQLLNGHADEAQLLAFLHLQWREGPTQYRISHVRQLFERLLVQPWSAEYEDEAFGLLGQLSDAEVPAARLVSELAALHRLTDRMVAARYTERMKSVEHPEKLTRTELLEKKKENLRLARTGFADRLRNEAAKHGKALAPWITIERLYLEVLLDRDLKQVAATCWDFLGDQPSEPREVPETEALQEALGRLLQGRYLLTVANLAVRKDSDKAHTARLLKYADAGIAADPEAGRWKLLKMQLLIALDRPQELEEALQQWLRGDKADNRWRLMLGYLQAERGRLAEAIQLFETVEKADELGPTAYRTLADWYMVVNQREKHERAMIAAYKTAEEYYLSRMLGAHLRPWQQGSGHLPSELNPQVLLIFTALFEKSASPQSYLWQLQQFYQASRDFRLLTGLADAVVGHTAAKVYPFIQSMQSVLSEIRDEATADELLAHLARVRTRARTAVDQRALDLLEVQVERRCAEVLNQPGPHVNAALAALQRAFQHDWSAGEPRLMGDFLAGLGRITQEPLAREQLRQLETLHRQAARGSFDRLHLADRLASTHGSYSREQQGIDLLQAALREYQDASKGVLPVTANNAVTTLISLLESIRHHTQGENLLFAQLKRPAHEQQARWLTQKLYELYHHALQTDSEVSLGKGEKLYQGATRKLQDRLDTPDQNHCYQLVILLCNIYRTAQEKKLPHAGDDLQAFVSLRLPQVLKRQTDYYDSIVNHVAHTLHSLVGPRAGVAFLVERIANEPRWLRHNNQDGWNRHAWSLAYWRHEAKELGEDLDARLLKIVLAELRRDLETQQQRNRTIYQRQHGYFWALKADAFARTAEEVLAQRKQSGAAVRYIAEYLFFGLDLKGRAIVVLFDAHRQKLLDEGGQAQLVDYLRRENRHAESIPLLQPLVVSQPENLQYRVWLMHAYFRTGRQADLLALLKETDTFFHQKDRWTEGVLAGLAHSCLENQLFAESAAYYNELIPLHQRTQPGRGIGNGTLSHYYTQLAHAYTGLRKTAEAVDAASGAIVSWGPTHRNRAQALETLKQVVRQAPDLDAYVTSLDKQSAETGLHNPIVRKAIGQAYLDQGRFAQAIVQLQLAVELRPNDAETHQLLVTSYDRAGDKEGGIRQLLQSVQLSRRDLKLYQELGRRLGELQRPKEEERAYTSMVEMLPSESESHTALAEVRQQQNRWSEAMKHWEQVARIRSLEPTGLLKLAAAQIHERQWDKAAQSLRALSSKSWPQRFSNVEQEVRTLRRQMEKAKK